MEIISRTAYRKIVVLTGAGVSVASGLPTYRGAGGLWDKDDAMARFAEAETWRRDPLGVWQIFAPMRRVLRDAKPNAGHFALAAFESDLPAGAELHANDPRQPGAAGPAESLLRRGDHWPRRRDTAPLVGRHHGVTISTTRENNGVCMSRRSMIPRKPTGPTRSASGSTTPYITRRGYRVLTAEIEHLWGVERPKITQEVADAAAHGDRSENAEYQYGKKKLRELDRRLRFLSKRIDELEVIDPEPEQEGRVFFGAYVTIEDEDGAEQTYQIVGADEYDMKLGRISVDSPMAKALLGRSEGDCVIIRAPKGTAEVTIVAIAYETEPR